MKEKNLNQFLVVSGIFGLIILAIIFDLILLSLVDKNATQGGLEQVLIWTYPLLELLWAVAAVGLLWLIVSSGGTSRWVSVLSLVVGLLVLYSMSLLFVLDVPEQFYVLVEHVSPGTLLYQAGAVVAAFGLFSLAMWKPAALDGDDVGDMEEDQEMEVSSDDSEVSTEVGV